MKKIAKISLAIISSLVITSAANAGALNVTGAAKATYTIVGSDSATAKIGKPKGIGIANEFTLGASGELDNGYTWNYAIDIDGTTVQDDARLEVGTPFGTIAAYIHESSLSGKYGFDASAYAPGSDYGYTGTTGSTFTYGANMSSYNSIQYHSPAGALPMDMIVKVGYAPEADGTINSSNASGTSVESANAVSEYYVQLSPIDGLSLKGSYLEKTDDIADDGTKTKQSYEVGGIAGKYSFGPATVGYGKYLIAPTLGVQTADSEYTMHYENNSLSLGVNVNDALSVSWTTEESTAMKRTNVTTADGSTKNDVDTQIDAIQAAYTMGGMTLSVAHKDIENVDYTLNKDAVETVFAVVMAF